MTVFRRPEPIHYFWCFALLSAVLLLAPIRAGDLAGYDDALYAHMAKGVVLSGDWLNIRSNGEVALEHPPLVVWTEAALFSVGGFSDTLAKLPSALCGWGTILLVYWLARRLLGDRFAAVLAMFAMATSIYFLKYASRAMTDVPCTFLFIAAVCAWVRTEENSLWYLAAGALTAGALMSRGLIGFGLPVIFAADLVVRRRKPPFGYAAAALVLAFLPLGAWYAHVIAANRERFFGVHATWLRNEVYGALSPPWRRYTGAPEYLWMLAKSYWPWLPALVAGIAAVWKRRDPRLMILLLWVVVVFVLCAAARSRVLRYLLPAYPAFAILAAIGMTRFVPRRYLEAGLRLVTPLLAVAVAAVAIAPPVIWHARDVRPLARAETAATSPGERVLFYDEGNPRFDVSNQLQWYGGRNLVILFTPEELNAELEAPRARTFIVDRAAFDRRVRARVPYAWIAATPQLVCFQIPQESVAVTWRAH